MKKLLILAIFLIGKAYGACDSPLSRTNYSANQILTSTALNADLNQLLNQLNALPGDCVTDGTIDFAKLDSTSFSVALNAIQQGLKVTRSDAATLTVGKGYASVNGTWSTNSASKNVTWSCSGCASEVASTLYYLYVKDGVSATMATTDFLISTTAPGNDGISSSNLVLARFYNDADSNIDQYSIDQWDYQTGAFIPQETGWIDAGGFTIDGATTDPTLPTFIEEKHYFRRDGSSIEVLGWMAFTANDGAVGSGNYHVALPTTPALRFATDVDGAAPWVTSGSLGSSVGNPYGSIGTFRCAAGSTISAGGVFVRQATSVRVFYHNQANTQFYWFSSTGQCQFDTTDSYMNIRYKAKIAGWND